MFVGGFSTVVIARVQNFSSAFFSRGTWDESGVNFLSTVATHFHIINYFFLWEFTEFTVSFCWIFNIASHKIIYIVPKILESNSRITKRHRECVYAPIFISLSDDAIFNDIRQTRHWRQSYSTLNVQLKQTCMRILMQNAFQGIILTTLFVSRANGGIPFKRVLFF